jgi:hypothetical protein
MEELKWRGTEYKDKEVLRGMNRTKLLSEKKGGKEDGGGVRKGGKRR